MDLIPTRSKEKLPAGFSYPVGAEAISEALRGAPQFEEFVLQFAWRDNFWASQYQEKLAALGRISIVVVWYFQGWSIQVNSVPRAHAHVAKVLVLEQALPALVQALQSAAENPTYFRWVAGIDLSSNSLITDAVEQGSKRNRLRKYRAPTRSRNR
jgi:hypothetical protein